MVPAKRVQTPNVPLPQLYYHGQNMATYTIQLKNEDPWIESTIFYLYQAAPACKAPVYAAVCQSVAIDAGSTGELKVIAAPYAVVGTTKNGLSDPTEPIVIENLDSRPVQLTKRPVKGSVVRIDRGSGENSAPYFDDGGASTTTADASFRISASENAQPLSPEESIVMGLGAQNPITGEIVPVALVPAQAGKTLTFTPELLRYYIALGDFQHSKFERADWVTYDWFTEVDFRGKSPGSRVALVWRRDEEGNMHWIREDGVEAEREPEAME
ncbi:hypothetical protein Dda_9056 [Drechslerella dactyloides]|uniref:Uncharacterized protein n=1 Tax=Drechslerella dactyloides TaxID=74499 RepID=A0AAD6IQ20_DREDA|nr:hypothetical protein Dda_9056 [Drechslerella dactyloides]